VDIHLLAPLPIEAGSHRHACPDKGDSYGVSRGLFGLERGRTRLNDGCDGAGADELDLLRVQPEQVQAEPYPGFFGSPWTAAGSAADFSAGRR